MCICALSKPYHIVPSTGVSTASQALPCILLYSFDTDILIVCLEDDNIRSTELV
jgi:hypothetical protein